MDFALTCSKCKTEKVLRSSIADFSLDEKISIARQCGWCLVPKVLCVRCSSSSIYAICSVCGLLNRLIYIKDFLSFEDRIKILLNEKWSVVPKLKCPKCNQHE